ncbi:n4bp1-pending-prov protein [Aphelenchoides avenae]|nr:n4bp1-pending-prov protein [Aphelenchus avenae]
MRLQCASSPETGARYRSILFGFYARFSRPFLSAPTAIHDVLECLVHWGHGSRVTGGFVLFETIDEQLLEFATKLGYAEESLRTVLEKLGPGAGQDQVLAALVKLGKKTPGKSSFGAASDKREATPSVQTEATRLRSVVIDGSNLAMTHGHKEVFSCRGIRDCVDFFVHRKHTDVLVFVPQFRREQPRSDNPIVDQARTHILLELEAEQRLVWTPSRRVGGRRIVCHDDRYILKTALEKDAVIVSNDEYRDLVKENPQYRQLVEQRLLMYSFVDGKFMPPDDPLGRRGPKLDQFLSIDAIPANAQLCPYAKKCTYGNKCKYYHPERPNGVRQSVTDRLLKERNYKKPNVAMRPSLIYEQAASQRADGVHHHFNGLLAPHNAVGRTHSVNLPLTKNVSDAHNDDVMQPAPIRIPTSFPFPPPPVSVHAPVGRWDAPETRMPSSENAWVSATAQPQFASVHTTLNRNSSAPLGSGGLKVGDALHRQHSPSTGNLNQLQAAVQYQFAGDNSLEHLMTQSYSFAPVDSHMFAPSTEIWGESEFSVGPISTRFSPPNPTFRQPSGGIVDKEREKLQYHLCQLFPEATVLAVMSAHPEERDPQSLCQRILAFQKGFTDA